MSDPARQAPVSPVQTWATEVLKFGASGLVGQRRKDVVIAESPLTLQADGTSYTLLRTPGNDRELVVGFMFTEGLIKTLDDILVLGECPDLKDTIAVKTAGRVEKPRRTLVITSSCGLCGREDIDGLLGSLGQVESDRRISFGEILRVATTVRDMQPLFLSTGSAHAAALIQPDSRIACVREDVGRHNALDKLLGHALMHGLAMGNMVLFLSGRTSLEMIIKVARAGIPIVAAVGAPTDAAVKAADRLGITLCGFLREASVSVYTHSSRVGPPGLPCDG